jgi:hypothetical protein
MKRVIASLIGLTIGGSLSIVANGGCSCLTPPPAIVIPAGTYKGFVVDGPDMSTDSDYQLVISSDQTLATETFTRGGVLYENQYHISGAMTY